MRACNPPRRHAWHALLVALCVVAGALSGCARDQSWHLVNITGVMPPLEFSLADDAGQALSAGSYRGKVVMLYFGYTSCTDVCPTTLARLSQSLAKLGSAAANVRVLFVTVDPKRDTAERLRRYTQTFGPEFVGLRTDDAEQLRELNKRYRVTYSLGEPDAKGDYEVTHSNAVFIFDAAGRARLIAEASDSATAIAEDLRKLLDGA